MKIKMKYIYIADPSQNIDSITVTFRNYNYNIKVRNGYTSKIKYENKDNMLNSSWNFVILMLLILLML